MGMLMLQSKESENPLIQYIKELVESVKERDPAARTTLEILTCYPGVHALLIHRLSHALWQKKAYWLARVLSHVARFFTGIEIHPAAVVGSRVFIDHGMGVVIGSTAEIGDGCTLYQGVTLGGVSTERCVKRHPTLKKNVIVGAGAKVLGPIVLGESSKVGSNAVVVDDVPDYITVTGIPARALEKRKKRSHARSEEFVAYASTSNQPDSQSCEILELKKQVKYLLKTLESHDITLNAPNKIEKLVPSKKTRKVD